MNKSSVVHFEMPYKNAKRVSDFYSGVFGWDMQGQGKDMGDYILAVTSEVDEKGRNKNPGTINGGLFKKTKSTNPYPSFVIGVDNLEEAMKRIKESGGEIIGEPQEIPGVGMWAVFKDTEGNKVSILQPKM